MDYLRITSHDAFRYGGLNKSAAEVYWLLLATGAMTVNELVEKTGRSRRTVFRVLARMAQLVNWNTGELHVMVERDRTGAWRAFPVDLDQVAGIIGTAGIGEKQREKHRNERRAHRRALDVGKTWSAR